MSAILEILLYVEDPAAAASFLESVAGLVTIERNPDFTVLVSPAGLRIALRPPHFASENALGVPIAHATPPGAELVIASDDVDADHLRAVALGARSLLSPSRLSYGDVASALGPGGLRLSWFARSSR